MQSFSSIIDLPPWDQALVALLIAMIRTLVESSPAIFLGILVAAGLQTAGGYRAIAPWLSDEGSSQRVFQLMLGCAMVPLCALGILPVVMTLAAGGMPRRDLVVVWLGAPLLNPLSWLYALSILPIWQCGTLAAVAVGFLCIIAEVAGRFSPEDEDEDDTGEIPAVRQGTTRLWNIAIAAGRIATSRLVGYVAIGLAATGLTSLLIVPGAFELLFSYGSPLGPAATLLLVGPQTVTPVTFVMANSGIHHAHLSFACAIPLQLLGVAWCGATVAAMASVLGGCRTLGLLTVTLLLALFTSYTAYALFPPAVGEEEETHGFDTLARPYHASAEQWSMALGQQLRHTGAMLQGGTLLLGILAIWGLAVRGLKLDYRHDSHRDASEKAPENTPQGRWNVELSSGQVGVAGVFGVAALCLMVMYSIFPGVEESFEEMQSIQADAVIAVNSNKRALAQQKLAEWDTVAARMPVGWLLRFGLPDEFQTEALRQLRTALWETQQVVAAKPSDHEARQQGRRLLLQFQECRKVCLGEKS